MDASNGEVPSVAVLGLGRLVLVAHLSTSFRA